MVFDTFCIFNELDLLEMRLNILDPYVDFFVINESKETFSGQTKPLYYWENKERFKQWHHKILHHEARTIKTDNAFERAGYQKDSIRLFLKKPLLMVRDTDTIYFGDIDEIWKPQYMRDDKVYNLRQLNYCYYLNNRSSEEWVGTIVGTFHAIKNGNLNVFRGNHLRVLDNGGWHFTNMGGAEQIRKKLASYDHQEHNTRVNDALLEDRIKDGEDYAGRELDWQGKPFKFWIDESELPEYIINNKKKYVAYFKS